MNSSDPITFAGANEDIEVVLGLRMERFHKKDKFIQFKSKIYTYVLTNFKDGQDLMPAVKKGEDPVAAYTTNKKPMTLEEDADAIDKAILSEKSSN